MCNLYSITTNQAAIAALFAWSTATSAIFRPCPVSSLTIPRRSYETPRAAPS
jgi:hypothetical protein